jgi:hypothetical protein
VALDIDAWPASSYSISTAQGLRGEDIPTAMINDRAGVLQPQILNLRAQLNLLLSNIVFIYDSLIIIL